MSGSTYTYDLMGNRQSESIILNATTTGGTLRTAWNYSTGTQNTYTSILASSGLTYTGVTLSGTLLTDSNGNIYGNTLSGQQQHYFYYDHENRLVGVNKVFTGTTQTKLATYEYDPLGRRTRRMTPTEFSLYYYYKDYLTRETISSSGTSASGDILNVEKQFLYGPNGPDDIVAVQQRVYRKYGTGTGFTLNSQTFYYEKDQLGSVERITNDSGSVIEEYTYTPFGGTYIKNAQTNNKYIPISLYYASLPVLAKNTSTGLIYNTRLYTGREYDKDISLYYLRARHYDPISGRFLQRDPIGTKDDSNLYRYVRNNPLTFTDPSGLRAKEFLYVAGLSVLETLGGNTRGRDAILRNQGYIKNYGDNSVYIKSIIFEEQAHLSPHEAFLDGVNIINYSSRGLGQINYKPRQADIDFFGYRAVSLEDVLDEHKNIALMNERINTIKEKLLENGKEVNMKNIGSAWNGGQTCITGICASNNATNYGNRTEEYSKAIGAIENSRSIPENVMDFINNLTYPF